MRRMILAVLVLAACGDGGGEEVVVPAGLDIVSGNGQVAEVATTEPSPSVRVASTVGDYELLPEPLVVQLTDESGDPIASIRMDGSSVAAPDPGMAAAVAPGTLVGFHVIEEGCGEAFVGAGTPDDSAQAQDRWVKGTLAGECHMEARLILNGEPTVAETFTATFLPGPVVRVQWDDGSWKCVGDTVDIRDHAVYAYDEHHNRVPIEDFFDTPPGAVEWQWVDRFANSEAVGPSGAGWVVQIPDFAPYGFHTWDRTYMDDDGNEFQRTSYAPGLVVTINGGHPDYGPGYAYAADVFVPEDCPAP